MPTHRGVARKIRAQWRMTNHAIDRLADRGVAATELIDLLLAPGDERQFDTAEDGKPLYCVWNHHIGVVYVMGIDYETGDSVKVILSVYLSGRGKEKWEEDALALAGRRRSMKVIQIDELLESVDDALPAPVVVRPKPLKRAPAPVVVSSVYDRVPPRLLETARMLLELNGLDKDDMRAVVVTGKNSIEVDPTRLKRLKRVS